MKAATRLQFPEDIFKYFSLQLFILTEISLEIVLKYHTDGNVLLTILLD